MGFKSCLEYLNIWYKAAVDADGGEYETNILVYVNDILIVYKDSMKYMEIMKDNLTVNKIYF